MILKNVIVTFIVLIFIGFSFNTVLGKHQKTSYRYQSEPKIVGGFPADQDSTRFIASLRLTVEEEYFKFGYGHKCGASLINDNVLLSAAHCFFVYNNGPFEKELRDPCDWTIVLGSYNRFTKETTTLIRTVKGLTIHADYDDSTMENDIALLFLNESVSLIPGAIEKIKLNDQQLEVGLQCQASGWGRIEYNGALADDLQSVNISVIDSNVCNDTNVYGGEIYDGMLCVGKLEGGMDSCQGDSGGPLVCDNLLAGVVSWGYRCAEPNAPGVYTNVNYFSTWIQAAVDFGPETFADCEPLFEPSTENPIYPTSSPVSEVPTTTPSRALHMKFSVTLIFTLVFIIAKIA